LVRRRMGRKRRRRKKRDGAVREKGAVSGKWG
jgi:hypothetical protein